jgi:hypothetical protein
LGTLIIRCFKLKTVGNVSDNHREFWSQKLTPLHLFLETYNV